MTAVDPTNEMTLGAALAAASGDAFVIADTNGRIRFWNDGAERMFGHERDEAIGSSLDIIIPENLRARHWAGYEKTMATGETKYGNSTLAVPALRADGTRISIEFTVALLYDEAGGLFGIGAIIRDVTEAWQRNRAQTRRMAELERELADLRR